MWYLLYLLHGVGTWARFTFARTRGKGYVVEHFWGALKPWHAQFTHEAYLSRLRLPTPPRTECQRRLAASAAALERQAKRGLRAKVPPPLMVRQRMLPGVSVAKFPRRQRLVPRKPPGACAAWPDCWGQPWYHDVT